MSSEVAPPDLQSKLESILRPHLKLLAESAEIGRDTPLGDLGLDSMASINLLFDLETELGISIPDDRIDENSFDSLERIEELLAGLS